MREVRRKREGGAERERVREEREREGRRKRERGEKKERESDESVIKKR